MLADPPGPPLRPPPPLPCIRPARTAPAPALWQEAPPICTFCCSSRANPEKRSRHVRSYLDCRHQRHQAAGWARDGVLGGGSGLALPPVAREGIPGACVVQEGKLPQDAGDLPLLAMSRHLLSIYLLQALDHSRLPPPCPLHPPSQSRWTLRLSRGAPSPGMPPHVRRAATSTRPRPRPS